MKKKLKAFTLAEALILLLIAALIAAALVPVITRKHREVGEHGKWICSMNDQGHHVIKTIYRGKTSQFKEANDSDFCLFSPPPAAKNFTIKAVGGGGGGAGGTQGEMESIFDSRTSDNGTFAGSVENDGYYSIIAVGGGGGGGGMACGEAKDQSTAEAGNLDLNKKKVFLEQSQDHHLAGSTISEGNLNGKWHEDWSWDQKAQTYDANKYNYTPCVASNPYNLDCTSLAAAKSEDPFNPKIYKYGYFDLPVSGFDYNLLFQNDKKFTDKYNYGKQNPEPKAQLTNEKGQFTGQYVPVYDFKYTYLPTDIGTEADLKEKAFCFAEKDWPMSKEIAAQNYKGLYLSDMDAANKPNIKCWNLPGMGGEEGKKDSSLQGSPVFLKGGQSIYASVGQAGKGEQSQTSRKKVGLYVADNSFSNLILKTDNVYDGLDGRNGESTSINYGTKTLTVAGGAGGASRKLLPINFYVNIPVDECEVLQGTREYPDDYNCAVGEHLSPGQCVGVDDCTEAGPFERCIRDHQESYPCGTEEEPKTCYTTVCDEWQQYWTCSTHYHTGAYYYKGGCVQRVRPKYFDSPSYKINACVYSKAIPNSHPAKTSGNIMDFFTGTENFLTGLDYPYFNNPVKEYQPGTDDGKDYEIASFFNRKRYQGDPGSGGYGAGEQVKSYVKTDDDVNSYGVLRGEDGHDGYVTIVKSSAYGGTGGQAGQYVSTMVKKLEKLKVTIGHGGAPGGGSANGLDGGRTKILRYNDDKELFVLDGGPGGQAKKLFWANSTETVPGGDGTPSPVENESNKAKIVPYGGLSNTNTSMSGQSAKIYSIWQNPTAAAMQTTGAFTFVFTGGHPLDMTYGAGGGGGAGGKTSSGGGGAGTPGVVIIEW